MKRLTKKIGDNYCSQTGDFYDLYNKLGKLEDLEDELGCPLDVVFNALKQPIYSTHPKTKKLCLIICPTFYFSGNQWLIGCHSMEWNAEEMCCDSWDCFPKDYKKTWWLKEDKSE